MAEKARRMEAVAPAICSTPSGVRVIPTRPAVDDTPPEDHEGFERVLNLSLPGLKRRIENRKKPSA